MHDLACRRGDRVLFRGLSFALNAGEALQVTGTNGTGKSSLLRLVAGLARPFAGSVARHGAVGLVDERPALDPELPLERALAFWRGLDGRTPVDLDALGLADLLDVPVRYLSTGQRKRAAMARLLGQRAEVWLLDEPLNGLDVHAAALVERLAAAHCREGGVLLIASHQPFALAGMREVALADFAP
ncbi:heme exporter protein A [Novosphingobium chloroacetimidivorans]|uniref:Heme exporter protein A n=1 Tax=Novosphingobium chloroacetimidivorans TaxID=1428314 RepID=A0A7W7KA96_9SPHN|nr:heme exporter protein A [Novosphingobium chloroacetimidivorans]